MVADLLLDQRMAKKKRMVSGKLSIYAKKVKTACMNASLNEEPSGIRYRMPDHKDSRKGISKIKF
jgi:hypothetical protein